MNVCFEYLYRDAGNNKKWGEVTFANRENIDTSLLDERIRSTLIDGEFFVAKEVGVPEVFFEKTDNELDHDWHQYFAIQSTPELANDKSHRDITEFVDSLQAFREKHKQKILPCY